MTCSTSVFRLSVLLGAVFAAAPAVAGEANCNLNRILSVEMAELPNGLWTVPMTLNGRVVQLMFDTGGGVRALTPKFTDELGLARAPVPPKSRIPDGPIEQVSLAEAVLGGGKLPEGMVFAVTDPAQANAGAVLPRLFAPGDSPFDGTITPDMFYTRADVELDFAGKKFNLFSNEHCKGQVVYWPAAAIATVPFTIENGRITFMLELDGKPVRTVLDTGAGLNTLDLGAAQANYQVDVNAADVTKNEAMLPGKTVYEKRFATLGMDVLTIRNPLMVMVPPAAPAAEKPPARRGAKAPEPPAMLLGMAMLKRLHIFIAFKEQMLYITPATAPQPAAPAAAPAAQ